MPVIVKVEKVGRFCSVVLDNGERVLMLCRDAKRLEGEVDGNLLRREREVPLAKECAYRYLSIRDRTVAEMRRYLTGKGFSDATVKDVLDFLREVSLLDDKAFARKWVGSRGKDRGKRLLLVELSRLGVERDIIEEVLGEQGDSEFDVALSIAEKRWKRMVDLPPEKKRRRLASFLLRRGFSWDVINNVLERLSSE